MWALKEFNSLGIGGNQREKGESNKFPLPFSPSEHQSLSSCLTVKPQNHHPSNSYPPAAFNSLGVGGNQREKGESNKLPGSAGMAQDATGLGLFSTSTRHIRR